MCALPIDQHEKGAGGRYTEETGIITCNRTGGSEGDHPSPPAQLLVPLLFCVHLYKRETMDESVAT